MLQAAPPNRPLQLASLSVAVLVVSFMLRAILYAPAQKAFPFMVGLASLGLIGALWFWYFQQRRSNGAILLFLMGNMLLMIVVVLPFALLTRDLRRSHDPKGLPKLDPSPPVMGFSRPVAPAQLPALGYLPRDTNLIAALHVRELLQQRDGREFLAEVNWSPNQRIDLLQEIKQRTGLSAEALDHVVVGLRPGTSFLQFTLPQLFLVVQTRQPYDVQAFSRELTDGKKDVFRGRPLYRFQPRPVGEGFLWCATDRYFVLALWFDGSRYEDVRAGVPTQPALGSAGLPPALQACLEQRVSKNTLLWMAGTKVSPEWLKGILPFTRTSKGALPEQTTIKTFHLGLRFQQKQVALFGEFQCDDAAAAQRLQSFFARLKFPGLMTATATAGLPSAVIWAAVCAEGPEPLTMTALVLAERWDRERRAVDGAEHWVSLQIRGTPDEVRAALQR